MMRLGKLMKSVAFTLVKQVKHYKIALMVIAVILLFWWFNTREGFATEEEEEEPEEVNEEDVKAEENEAMTTLNTSKTDGNDDEDDDVYAKKVGAARVDYAANRDVAYKNIQKSLGKDGVNKLAKETKNLMDQQKQLLESMKTLEPMVANAKDLMKTIDFDGMKNMISNFTTMNK